jgi:hypothetical protein
LKEESKSLGGVKRIPCLFSSKFPNSHVLHNNHTQQPPTNASLATLFCRVPLPFSFPFLYLFFENLKRRKTFFTFTHLPASADTAKYGIDSIVVLALSLIFIIFIITIIIKPWCILFQLHVLRVCISCRSVWITDMHQRHSILLLLHRLEFDYPKRMG